MTTTESSNALATRNLTDAQIQQRIRLNQQAGWGLEKATPAALNLVFLYCQKYQLLPGDDVTLYEGKPWLTIEGRTKLMRRHPEYRGFSCRPLSKVDKEAWGYDPDDIVVECTIRTSTWGEISARGKVSRDEAQGTQVQGRRLNYVARIHPVEMAEKRAISRAERAAFGADAVIEDEDMEEAARVVIEERTDPARVAANAAAYDRIIAPNYDDEFVDERPNVQPAADDGELVKNKNHPAWKAWSRVAAQAQLAQIEFAEIELPVAESALRAATESLADMVAAKAEPAELPL